MIQPGVVRWGHRIATSRHRPPSVEVMPARRQKMKVKWEVDDGTTVEAEIRRFGKHQLIVNGTNIPSQISKRPFPFELPGGRHASISLQPQFMAATIVKLTVDDQLMIPTGSAAVTCQSC